MRTLLTSEDVRAAVIGGAILGGGGGGHIPDGLALGESAVTFGEVELWTIDEFAPDDVIAICAGVGAPGAPDMFLLPVHFLRALERLQDGGGPPVRGLATNENGAMGTVNGWLQAAITGLPVVDAPCNGRAHPTALMGSLGLHRDPSFRARAGFAGGKDERYVEGVVAGSLASVSRSVRELSVVAGGVVAVARNPVPARFLGENGCPGGIAQAIAVGRAHARGGVDAVAGMLRGRVLASGPVEEFAMVQSGGFDVGELRIGSLRSTFVNEYMTAEVDGVPQAVFPDLMMTFAADDGTPLVSADLAVGRDVTFLAVDRSELLLSSTMAMDELLAPVEELLGRPLRPAAG